jgi:signal transduction histidine kinase/CheY-like chemotaxis protein
MADENKALISPLYDPAIARLALETQEGLLPQALGAFALTLPIFVWLGSFARDSAFMAATFAVFAINWGAFYAIVSWRKRQGEFDVRRRQRVNLLGGLLWAVAAAQVAALGANAGPAREALLMASVAAAVMCMFFSAASLSTLLIVAPVAMAGPLTALESSPDLRFDGVLALGAFALAFLCALILNRILRRQFALAVERESLVAAQEASLERVERLARSKSDLIATLSSEIRNGLTAVAQVLSSAAGNGGRAAPSREQVGAALAGVNDLVAVLNATLDSETAEAGDLAVTPAPFDPAAVAREAAAPWRGQATGKGLEFSLYVDAELGAGGAAIADATRVRQILAHLIGNAVKYTVRGRVEVRVERRGADRLAVAVADTGPGLSAEELARAYQPFGRVARTGAGVPGAGLGLSLSRRLAELMGATIEAESAVGVGSCFTLELPFDPTAEVAGARDDGARGGRRGLKVLVAESDSFAAAALRAVLEQLGHHVVQAQDGRRALDLALSLPLDLFVIAARLPGVDGARVIAELRAAKGPVGATPLIALIEGDADEARACAEAGAAQIMRKPVTVGAVARAVTDAMHTTTPAMERAVA